MNVLIYFNMTWSNTFTKKSRRIGESWLTINLTNHAPERWLRTELFESVDNAVRLGHSQENKIAKNSNTTTHRRKSQREETCIVDDRLSPVTFDGQWQYTIEFAHQMKCTASKQIFRSSWHLLKQFNANNRRRHFVNNSIDIAHSRS